MPNNICRLDVVSDLALGYKSLQNNFFYVDASKRGEFRIEKRFLVPLIRMGDVDAKKFMQESSPRVFLFFCQDSESDLRGTHALKYIRAMADVPAVKKKQSRQPQTIREVLEKQGGKYWYSPKARPHKANLWLRKAFNGVFSPFIFDSEVTFDQRANSVIPKSEPEWRLIGAVLSSSVFSLAVESEGVAAMGAGALELPTTLLRDVKVPDIRQLSSAQKKRVIQLSESVWAEDPPCDWRTEDEPGKRTQKLDEWWLSYLKTSIGLREVYDDLANTCRDRISMAGDRKIASKTATTANIRNIAEVIATNVRGLLDSYQYPESFCSPTDEMLSFDFGAEGLAVRLDRFLSVVHLLVENIEGHPILEKELPAPVAEVILRALLLGRRRFAVPTDPKVAKNCVDKFFPWIEGVQGRINDGWRDSALGTQFEERVHRAVYSELQIHNECATAEVYKRFFLKAEN